MTREETAAKLEGFPATLRMIAKSGDVTDAELQMAVLASAHKRRALSNDLRWLAAFLEERIAAGKAEGRAVETNQGGKEPLVTVGQAEELLRPLAGIVWLGVSGRLAWDCFWGGGTTWWQLGSGSFMTLLVVGFGIGWVARFLVWLQEQ